MYGEGEATTRSGTAQSLGKGSQVDAAIKSRHTANAALKQAGIDKRF
jgi:hypothetical protein